MKKELSSGSEEGRDTPIIKSLFDIKGNSKFKNAEPAPITNNDKGLNESSESEEEEEKKKDNKIVFKSSAETTRKAFPNPFGPKNNDTVSSADKKSSVFSTGKLLWANPFGCSKPL